MNYRVATIQMTSCADVDKNLVMAEKWITAAVQQGAKLIVLPEMFALMGMDQMDKVHIREEFGSGTIQYFLHAQAKKHRVWIVGGTIPLAAPASSEKVSAACLVYDDTGNIVARYDKIHLFDVRLSATSEIYSESKTIVAGKEVVVFSTPFGKIGLAVCYDVRFPELFRTMHDYGVELIVIPAAFTYTTGQAHWETLLRARAIENQVFILAAAQTGTHENGRKTYGHSMIVDPWGAVQAVLSEEEGVVVTDIDFDYLRKVRGEFPVLTHRRVQ